MIDDACIGRISARLTDESVAYGKLSKINVDNKRIRFFNLVAHCYIILKLFIYIYLIILKSFNSIDRFYV